MSKETNIVYIDDIVSHYVIVIGNWEKVISEDENYDPFDTFEQADEYRKRNLQ